MTDVDIKKLFKWNAADDVFACEIIQVKQSVT